LKRHPLVVALPLYCQIKLIFQQRVIQQFFPDTAASPIRLFNTPPASSIIQRLTRWLVKGCKLDAFAHTVQPAANAPPRPVPGYRPENSMQYLITTTPIGCQIVTHTFSLRLAGMFCHKHV